jgi:hypothetical protein
MKLATRIFAGIFALSMAGAAVMPATVHAEENHWWSWHHHDNDDWNRAPGYGDGYQPGYGYGYQRGYIPPNGQGMISRRNPNLVWTCNSEGHHCHWARRHLWRRW